MPTPNNQSIVETTATSPDVSLRPSRIQLACPEETSAIHHHNSHPVTTTATTATTTTAPGWQQQDHIEHHLRQDAATVTTTTAATATTTATTTIAVQSGIEPFPEGGRILEHTTTSSTLPLPPLLSVDEEKVYTAATTTTTTTIAVAATAAPTIITTAVASPIRDLPAVAAGEQRTPVPSTSPSSSPSDKDPRSTPSPTTVATARKIFTQQSAAPAGGNASSNNTSSTLDTLSVPPLDHDFSTKRVSSPDHHTPVRRDNAPPATAVWGARAREGAWHAVVVLLLNDHLWHNRFSRPTAVRSCAREANSSESRPVTARHTKFTSN